MINPIETIKVIVVDDSALMRKIVSDMIDQENDMTVVATARNGEDLFNKIKDNSPDVVTLDVEMPKMDGITALKKLRSENINVPVIMLSSLSKEGPKTTMECLANGAFDFISKPSGSISLDIDKVKEELIEKIRLACKKKVVRNDSEELKLNKSKSNTIVSNKVQSSRNTKRALNNSKNIEAVVIGASTGGPKALYEVVTRFPENLGVPVFIVQHMPKGFTKAFAERLNNNSKIKVVEASDKEAIIKDKVYIAPGGFHMEIGLDKKIHLNSEPSIWGVRPAVDKLFISASKVYSSNIVSVVLTGMGKDGAEGTIKIKERGGSTISEDKSTCTIYGMPKVAFETGMVDEVLPLGKIADRIINMVRK